MENTENTTEKEIEISAEEAKQVKEALEIKPKALKKEDIKFEKGEEDVRELDPKDYRQIEYKFLTTQTALLHNMAQSLVDTQRLLMLVLSKLGVKDISKALVELYEELAKEAEDGKQQA